MNKSRVVALVLSVTAGFLSGCASRQVVTRVAEPRLQEVCVVEHTAVQTATLLAIQDGLRIHGLRSRVVKGAYANTDSVWQGSVLRGDVAGCEALLFYVANWNWDLAYYMRYAQIWMTVGDGSRRIGEATYDASNNIGPGKFIVARAKLLELMDQMFAGRNQANQETTLQPTPVIEPAKSTVTSKAGTASRLETLEDLRKKGLLTEDEYMNKRRVILDEL
jgi:hypothetical protein